MQTTKDNEKVRDKLEKLTVFGPVSISLLSGNGICLADRKLVGTTSAELVRLVLERKRFKATEARTKGRDELDRLLLNGILEERRNTNF